MGKRPRKASQTRHELKDTGFGIPPEVLARLFNAFEQDDPGVTQYFSGPGLGLSATQAIVEVHGRRIPESNEGYDGGATFRVSQSTADPIETAQGSETETRKPVVDALPIRVLLVEDHADTAIVLGRLLTRSGYVVTTADTVKSALRLAAAAPFDLVVSDIGLPDATGYELMRSLRTRYGINGISMSGYGADEDVRRSFEAGFSKHLVKPFAIEQLREAIQRVLASQTSVGIAKM